MEKFRVGFYKVLSHLKLHKISPFVFFRNFAPQ
jgi:hypothetical protein